MASAGGDDEGPGETDWMRSGLNVDQPRRSRMLRTVGALSAAGVITIGSLVVYQSTRPDAPLATAPEPATDSTADATSAPPAATDSSTPSSSPIIPYIDAGGSGRYVYVLDSPSLTATVVGTLPDGTEVVIICTTRGEVVHSPHGVDSDLWDYIDSTDGMRGGYVPNSWVNTGTDQPTGPSC